MVNNVVGQAFVVMVVILIVVGALLGTKAGDIEFLHPKAAESDAEQSAEDLRHQKELNRIEEDNQRAKSELDQKKESQQAAIEMQTAQRVAEAKVFGLYALIVVGAAILLFAGLSFFHLLIRRLDSLSRRVPAQRASIHPRRGGSHAATGKPELAPENLRPLSDRSHATIEEPEETYEKVLELF